MTRSLMLTLLLLLSLPATLLAEGSHARAETRASSLLADAPDEAEATTAPTPDATTTPGVTDPRAAQRREHVSPARTLNLVPVPPVPDLRLGSRSMDEATMKTARVLNPFLKIAPLAIGIPLGVAGVSIAASVPIAMAANDPFAAAQMYSAGMSLMGGAFAAVFTFDILARTLRFFLDAGAWQKDIAFLAVGAPLAIGGYALVAIGAQYSRIGTWADGAVVTVVAGGAVLWGVGLALLMIDTLQIAWKDNDPKITARERRPGVQFAGVWAAPVAVDGAVSPNGAAAGVSLRW